MIFYDVPELRCLTISLAILLLSSGCDNEEDLSYLDARDDVPTEQMAFDGDPDFFMMGQSNANPRLANVIAQITGMSIHQISHPNQPIESWFDRPYKWLDMDMAFLGNRKFRYFIWFQGESNRLTYDGYEEKFNSIVKAVSTHTHRNPFIIVVGVWSGENDFSAFNSFQQQMCDRHPDCHFIDSRDCSRRDAFHLDSAGRQTLANHINDLISTIRTNRVLSWLFNPLKRKRQQLLRMN